MRARNEYFEADRDLEVAHEEMAFILDDEVGTKYVIRETLVFTKVKTSLANAYEFSKRNNPEILASKVLKDTSERDYEVAFRENLPLPKFSVSLGSYRQVFGRSTYNADYTTFNGGSNIELVATLNASWTIYGEDGFFNKRKLEISHLNKEIANRRFLRQNDLTRSHIKRIYEKIINYEKQIELLEVRTDNSRKTFDIVLENYSRKKSSFVNFLHALRDYNDSETDLIRAKFNHLNNKVLLATFSGIEDFPSERFEALAKKKENIDDILEENN